MSSLGFQLVYSLLNERDDVVCERFFLNDQAVPLSLESGRRLSEFPFLFFSVSFEHDYINIVKILLCGGIEPFAEKRDQGGPQSPIVVFGGVAAFMNPEPICRFADLIVVGEAEPVIDSLSDLLLASHERLSREELLMRSAQEIGGVYAPRFYMPVYDRQGRCKGVENHTGVEPRISRRSLEHCNMAAHSELMTPEAEFSELFLTELGRGCSRGCRFCAAGFIYRPPRLWDADSVVQGLANRSIDVKRIGLLGMEMAGDDTLNSISAYLLESGCALSFSSLRADRINDKLLSLLSESSLKSVAIAPDGSSERLRHVINKGLKEDDLINASRRLVEAGIFKLKLYVMVGLPTETCEDLQEFVDLVGKIKAEIDPIGQKRGRLSEIFLSVNCFIPKAWTPFQFHPFGFSLMSEQGARTSIKDAVRNLKDKIAYLRKGVQRLSNVHFQADKPDNALFQALLARGDRRLADVLYDMASSNIPWKSSLKKHGLSAEQFVTAGYNADSYFPWYIIDHGIKHEYLWQEYVKGLRAASTEPCDTSICRRCGVCGEE